MQVKIFNEEQQAQLQEISANLRRMREEKSIDIQEIAAQTHIRPFLLQALESGKFEELPEPVFVKGFIRRYAEALGLNGTNLADCLQINYLPINSPQQDSNNPKKRFIAYIPAIAPYIILLLAASVGILYLLTFQFKGKFRTSQFNSLSIAQQNKVSSAAIPSPSPISTINLTPKPLSLDQPQKQLPSDSITSSANINKNNLTPVPSPQNAIYPDQLQVNLELKGQSWLHIKADGKTIFQGILNKGKHQAFTAKKLLTVRSGNAGVVLVSVNNQQPQPLGADGEVKEIKFSHD
jgi:cytoskeletal protein RodZ